MTLVSLFVCLFVFSRSLDTTLQSIFNFLIESTRNSLTNIHDRIPINSLIVNLKESRVLN